LPYIKRMILRRSSDWGREEGKRKLFRGPGRGPHFSFLLKENSIEKRNMLCDKKER